jgi:hypothetical protein
MYQVLVILFEEINLSVDIFTQITKNLNVDFKLYAFIPYVKAKERGNQRLAHDFLPSIYKIIEEKNFDFGLGISNKELMKNCFDIE